MDVRVFLLIASLAAVHADSTHAPLGYTTPNLHGLATTHQYAPSVHTPAVSSSSSHTQGAVTSTSHAVDTPHSSSYKTDVRVDNQGYSPPSVSYAVHELPSRVVPPHLTSQVPANPYVPSPYLNLPHHQIPSVQPYPTPNLSHPSPPFIPPHFQNPNYQFPSPLSFLNNFPTPPALHAMFNPSLLRGPVPSPGYYSPGHPPPSPLPLFNAGYSAPSTSHSPYNN